MKVLFVGAALAAALTSQAAVKPSFAGRVMFDKPKFQLGISSADPNWSSVSLEGGLMADDDGVVRCSIGSDTVPKVACSFKGERAGADGAHLVWTFTTSKDAPLAMLGVTGTIDYRSLPGGWVEADGKRIDFPKGRDMYMFRGEITKLALCCGDGSKTVLAFAKPSLVYLQNNRSWGAENFGLRLLVPTPGNVAKGGVTTVFDVTVTGSGAYDVGKALKPCTLKAGPDWVPFAATPWIKPGTALDFSKIRCTEAPAGKYGAVVANGGHFEFERRPGVPVRFYGINVCGDANTIPLDEARKFAANLARLGYNAIRFHHHETTMVKDMKDPRCCTLNPKSMEGFDALVTACVENGIYMTTDLFVSRHNAGLTWRAIGIDRDGTLGMDDAKRLIPVNEKLFANFLEFTRNFFGHVNQYTGRSFAEEPALMGVSFVNEGNLDKFGGDGYAKFPDWQKAYKAWLAKKQAAEPELYKKAPKSIPGNFKAGADTAFLVFLQETEAEFARKVQAFLRDELGCKALTTNMNDGWGNTAAFQWVRAKCYGYVDTHFYVDHPHFLGKSWQLPSQCPNQNPILGEAMGAQQIASVRAFERPFTITEYNFSGPGRFRGVGGIACGAQAALQDWAGLWRFAWSHGSWGVIHPERKGMGYFDLSGDPLSLAAERASICLFLRRDLEPLTRSYPVVMPETAVRKPGDAGECAKTLWSWASWYVKLGTMIGDTLPEGSAGYFQKAFGKSSEQVLADILPGAKLNAMPVAGDGHLKVDGEKGTFLLDTPRTSGGFAEGGAIDCGALRADLGQTAATLWASSVTDAPIAASDRILVTYLTDVQNSDIRYADAELTVLLDWGHLPHLMRNGEADVSLAVKSGDWKVWALDSDGTRREEVPSAFADGRLAFKVDVDRNPKAASFLYEAVRTD